MYANEKAKGVATSQQMISDIPQAMGAQTFADALQLDALSSIRNSVSVVTFNDTATISTAGLNNIVDTSGTAININLKLGYSSIINLAESFILFKLTPTNCHIPRANLVLQPTSSTIGGINTTYVNGQYFNAQLDTFIEPEVAELLREGGPYICGDETLPLAYNTAVGDHDAEGGPRYVVLLKTGDSGALTVRNDACGFFALGKAMESNSMQYRQGASLSYYCRIPLVSIWTSLARGSDPFLALLSGQSLNLQGQIVPAAFCALPFTWAVDNAVMSYTISNTQLQITYAALPQSSVSFLESTRIGPFQCVQQLNLLIPAQPNMSYQFAVSKGQFVRYLYLSFHYRSGNKASLAGSYYVASANNVPLTIGDADVYPAGEGTTATPFRNQSFSVPVVFDNFTVQVGAQLWNLRGGGADMLQHTVSGASRFKNRLMQKITTVYRIDLSRLDGLADALGSSGLDSTQVIISFALRAGDTIPGVEFDPASISKFMCCMNLELARMGVCEHGQYHLI